MGMEYVLLLAVLVASINAEAQSTEHDDYLDAYFSPGYQHLF